MADIDPRAAEIARRADEAWKMMTREPSILDALTDREPMPPGIALDYVQDATGGKRDDAVWALLRAAVRSLEWQIPTGDNQLKDTAVRCLKEMGQRDLSRAHGSAMLIQYRGGEQGAAVLAGAAWGTVGDYERFRLWGRAALIAIAWCQNVIAAQ